MATKKAHEKMERNKYLDAFEELTAAQRSLNVSLDPWDKLGVNRTNNSDIKKALGSVTKIIERVPKFSVANNESTIATINQLTEEVKEVQKNLILSLNPIADITKAKYEAEDIISKAPYAIAANLAELEIAKATFNEIKAQCDPILNHINDLKGSIQTDQNTQKSAYNAVEDYISNYHQSIEPIKVAVKETTRSRNLSLLGMLGGSLLTLVGAGILLTTGPIGFVVGAGLIAAGISTVAASAYTYREAQTQLEVVQEQLARANAPLDEAKDTIEKTSKQLETNQKHLAESEKKLNTLLEPLTKTQENLTESEKKLQTAGTTFPDSDVIKSLTPSIQNAKKEMDELIVPLSSQIKQQFDDVRTLIKSAGEQNTHVQKKLHDANELQQKEPEVPQVNQSPDIEKPDGPYEVRDNTELIEPGKQLETGKAQANLAGIRFEARPAPHAGVTFGDRDALDRELERESKSEGPQTPRLGGG